ncbi:response regulator [Chryseobacterium oranimense]|uniref:response regulator n=1 Tax=Chryseobacterium oranimense TaxID=421058 RepID=UPI0021AF85BD|nr:response regulator [Chryseobacterium oranimense]UWX60029.1 response regulator [Chryseobacterium oranimense]
MKVLIVDDSIHKIDILSKFVNNHSPNSYIDTAESIKNALSTIQEKDLIYNLIIIDQYLPLRNGEEPIAEGGKNLLQEMYRKLQNKIPNYIIGFSQYENEQIEFSKIWNVIKYDADSTHWKHAFSELLNHIKNNNFNTQKEFVLPTIFVEGLTDKFYIEQTILHYFPELIDKISVKTQTSAGSNWVANQLVAWSHSMYKDNDGNFIKCVGILDNDEAGRRSKKELDAKSFSGNQQKTSKSIPLGPKYNPSILDFYKKGCKIEIDIESLFEIDVWIEAESKGILEMRNPVFSEAPTNWQPFEETSKDFMLNQGISEQHLLYTKKVKSLKKDDFLKLVRNDESKLKQKLVNFKTLLDDIIKELGLNNN